MAGPQQRNPLAPPTPEEKAQQRAEQAKRRDELRVLMKTLHAEVLTEWGDEEGRREWQRANWKRRGRAKGTTKPASDWSLLKRYGAAADAGTTRGLPRRIKSDPDPALGDTSSMNVEAIKKRLQRARNRAEERRRAALAAGNPLALSNRDK
jgi:hypothetical protein